VCVVHIAMDSNCVIPVNGRQGNAFNRSVHSSDHTLENSEDLSKTRRRSGSWSGVNESEEGIQYAQGRAGHKT
jgi:hypothetical protein